jgi:hypothetical protein
MQRRIDLPFLYVRALGQLNGIKYDGASPRAWPAKCPFTLNELLKDTRDVLEERLRAASPV